MVALYSHHTNDTATVQAVLASGLREQLRPRLTNAAAAAAAEHEVIDGCLSQLILPGGRDVRWLADATPQPFTTRGAYHILHGSDQTSDVVRIWDTQLPTKVKFFAWLLHHGRLNTHAHLYHRNIKTHEESWCEHCHGTMETDGHIFYECNKARAIWTRLQLAIRETTLRRPWVFAATSPLPDAVRTDVMLLILWHIWKARNAMIFDHKDSSPSDVLRRIISDIDAWSCRYRKTAAELQIWRDWIVTH